MKIHTPFLTVLLAASISVVSIPAQQPRQIAQEPSLASVPAGERFISEKRGFTIALPGKPTESLIDEKDNRGVYFQWQFKEGTIGVKSVSYLDGIQFTTTKDREYFLKGYANVFTKSDSVTSITERPFSIGEFNGKTFTMLVSGQRVQINVLLAGDKCFEIMAMDYDSPTNQDSLIFKAANSFSLLPSPVK